jgi:hypothetical protein
MMNRSAVNLCRGFLLVVSLLLFSAVQATGQSSAGTQGKAEPRFIVDMPTAGMLGKGTYAVDVDFYQDGGVLVFLNAGIFERLSFGISYGGSKLLGSESPVMNELPGVNLKVRILEETLGFPALVVGFDSQGKDGYIKDLDRYLVKSPGLYAALSKNYTLLGYFSLHGGVNYSFERADDDRDINFYVGAEKTIGPFISAVLEYNAALNDNDGNAIGKGRGYLNAALKCSLGGGLTIGLNFKDFFNNARGETMIRRTARLEFASRF